MKKGIWTAGRDAACFTGTADRRGHFFGARSRKKSRCSLAQVQEFGLRDGRNRTDWTKDRSRHLAVDANKGNGIGPALGITASECEGSDIDAELASRASNLADDARFVAVSQVENCALQQNFQLNPFDLQHYRP